MIHVGLGGKIDTSHFRRVNVDTSGAEITLNAKMNSMQFISSDELNVAKEFIINANSSTREFWMILSITDLAAVLTFPDNVSMADPLWNAVDQEWTPIDLGLYQVKGVYDGTTWYVTITGLFSLANAGGIFDESFDESFE